MHHRCLTRRFMTASIFSPLPKQNRAAIRAWLLISPATAVRQLSRFLHPTNRMQSHGAASTMPGTEALGVTPGWHHGPVAHGDPPIPASRGDSEELEGLTLDEQARGVHSLALDAVGPAGVGTSVLPADREHREAPVAHLGTREDPGAWAGTPRRMGEDAPRFPRRRAAGAFRAG